jgi:hypothetical protein
MKGVWFRKNAKILAIIGLILTFVFGSIYATFAFIYDNNYIQQRKKYDAIAVGTKKNQVEAILGEGRVESKIPPRAHLEGEYDEIISYPMPLVCATSGSWVVVAYKDGREVSKCANGGDEETFFQEERPRNKLQEIWELRRSWLVWLIEMIVSSFFTFRCFVIANHNDFNIDYYKQVAINYFLIFELIVVIFSVLMAVSSSIDILLGLSSLS